MDLLWYILGGGLMLFAVFLLTVGILRYKKSEMKLGKAKRCTGVLAGFKDFSSGNFKGCKPGLYGLEYTDRRKALRESVPLFRIVLDGEKLMAALSDVGMRYTNVDIGKEFPLIYRQGFGLTVLSDNKHEITSFNKRQSQNFIICLVMSFCGFAAGIITIQLAL